MYAVRINDEILENSHLTRVVLISETKIVIRAGPDLLLVSPVRTHNCRSTLASSRALPLCERLQSGCSLMAVGLVSADLCTWQCQSGSELQLVWVHRVGQRGKRVS